MKLVSDRLRVLHVINGLGGTGGAENRLVEELLRFDQSVDQIVVRMYESDFLQARLEASGVPVVALGRVSGRGAWNWPRAAYDIGRLVGRFEPDVIHTSLFAANLAGQIAGLRTKIPVISTMTLTGDPALHRRFQPGAGTRRAATLRAMAAWVARHDGIWYRAVTEDTKQTNCLAMGFPTDRVRVIPRGIDIARGQTEPDRERFGLPSSVPLIVNVGRLTAQKGQVLLIEAFAQILKTIPDAHLAIAGEDQDAARAVRAAVTAHGLGERVHLLGFRSDAGVLMASGDVFVFSSLAEGLGTVVLEAMVAGLPVVSFDIPPVREVAGDSGWVDFAPIGDAQALADQAVAAWQRPDRATRAAEARRWVIDSFDVTGIARRLEEYLRSVARPRVAG